MGAANLSRKELQIATQIEAWAERSTLLHKAEGCDNNMCGGRRKIWWIVRHPKSSPEISNIHARNLVINKMAVCEPMLARLADGRIPWLDGEETVAAQRNDLERDLLLGKIFQKDLPLHEKSKNNVYVNSPEEISDPFPDASSDMPKLTKTEVHKERYRAWKQQQFEDERQRRQQARTPGGYSAVVDALQRKG